MTKLLTHLLRFTLTLSLAVAPITVFSTAGTNWMKGVACSALLGGTILSAPVFIDYQFDTTQILTRFEEVRRAQALAQTANPYTSIRAYFSNALGPIVQGPLRSMLNSMQYRMEGVSRSDSLLATLSGLGTYTSLVFGAKGLQRMFISIPHETFLEKSSSNLTEGPKSVLFLDLVGSKDRLAGYAQATFNRIYSEHTDAHFVHFEDLSQLERQLKSFDGKKFDRIEIMVHGKPGVVTAVDKEGTLVPSQQIAEVFRNLGSSLSHPQTELRLISCSLLNGQGLKESHDPQFREFLLSLLPDGGTIVGATKNILAYEITPDPSAYANNRIQYSDMLGVGMSYFLGAEIARTVLSSLFSLNRNYVDALKDIVVLKIDSSGRIERVAK